MSGTPTTAQPVESVPGAARWRAAVGTLVALATVATSLVGFSTSASASDQLTATPDPDPTVTADPLPTVQIDGVAWDQVVVGNRVYVAGEFTTARPAGSAAGVNTVPRSNLLAYDLATGELITSWAPSLDGPAYAIAASPDGSQIYVGGDFTHIGATARNRFAVLNPTTGAVITKFTGGANAAVRAIVANSTSVYIGGNFNTAAGQDRPRVARFNASTGAIDSWRTSVQPAQVDALALSSDGSMLFVGGRFQYINNIARQGIGAVRTSDGAVASWNINPTIYAYGFNAGIDALAVDPSTNTVYGAGWGYISQDATSDTNLEGIFAASQSTAAITWVDDCHGDTYSVYANPGEDHIYASGHPHFCNNIGGYPEVTPRRHQYAVAFGKEAIGQIQPNQQTSGTNYHDMQGLPAPKQRTFWPTFTTGTYTGLSQATWDVTGSGDYVVYGGEFMAVNGTAQQGLVRFAKRGIAPGLVGPTLTGSSTTPVAQSRARGTMSVSWPLNWDKDDDSLRYDVYRDGTLVASLDHTSRFWDLGRLSYLDTGLADSTRYTYQVNAVDSTGNVVQSPTVSATTVGSSGTQIDTYATAILADHPSGYWRLDSTFGSEQDWTGYATATVGNGVSRNQTGAIAGSSDRAMSFNGSQSGRVTSSRQVAGPGYFSAEAWFSTTSTAGGKIVGFGSGSGTNNSGSYDRHVYMTADGRLVFGLYPNANRTIETAAAYNDGAWHQVVASVGVRGMELYVDGVLAASDPAVTFGQIYNGYWHIGGDALNGWPDAAGQNFNGKIDEVAVYPRQLDADTVLLHYGLGSGQAVNLAPTAAFTAAATDATVDADATASTDPDGSLVSYDWTWGDGLSSTTTAATTSHTYEVSGSYTIGLTVTDDGGKTATASYQVDVVVPNKPPVASFTPSASGAALTVDATGSSDTDGSIVSYAWDFGDGATATGVTASHVYAASDTYAVTLTVTDDDGATGSSTVQVPIEAPETLGLIASDAFGRSVADGWGTADLGGAWVTTSGVASVSSGAGVLTVAVGAASSARLQTVPVTASVQRVTLSLDKRPNGSGGTVYVRSRVQPGVGEYRLKLALQSGGKVVARFARTNSAGTETALGTGVEVPGLTYSAGTQISVLFQATGTSPTSLQAKVWAASGSEPAGWTVETTDSTAALQSGGQSGVSALIAANTTNGPVTARFDDYSVVDPTVVAPPPPNAAPTAALSATGGVLSVAADASGSSDSDGSIVEYQWAWGDGESSTTTVATASHTYASAGPVTVTVTVKDDDGATASASAAATVEEPPAATVLARDAFERTSAAGWGTADLGGDWTVSTTGDGTTVAGGLGVMTLNSASQTRTATLASVSTASARVQTTVSLDKRPNGSGGTVIVRGRVIQGVGEYRLKLAMQSGGKIVARLYRADAAGKETAIGNGAEVPGVTYNTGTAFVAALEITGTTLRAKVWNAGATEPTAWLLEGTDSTAGLQGPGGVGLITALASNVTNIPVAVRFDDFVVTQLN